eukprot:gene5588-12741_t
MSINIVSEFGYSIMANDQDRKAVIDMAVNKVGIQIVKTHLEAIMVTLSTIFKSHTVLPAGVVCNVTNKIKCDIEYVKGAVEKRISLLQKEFVIIELAAE